jgi:multidrug efflux pump subunit AcrA (membrane-fusion protein)
VSTQVDLRALAGDRSDRGRTTVRRPRNLFARYVVPGLLLVSFAALLGWSLRDRWLPATPVTVVPVVATRAESQAANMPLFQAAGWVEPRPTPVAVSALAEGVVERLTVIEGQAVAANEPVAYLIDKDARLAVRQAQADLALRQAEADSAEAALAAAQRLLAEPITLKAMLAEAEANLTKLESELAPWAAMCAAARARRDFAEKDLASKRRAGDAIPAITLQKAESEVKVATAQADELTDKQAGLEKERAALTARRDVLARQLELKIDEERAVAEGRAQVAAAKAQVAQAEAALAMAELRLERMVVRAPMAGKILALTAAPGSKLMNAAKPESAGPLAMQMVDASTVVLMYDPASLQVRADVQLENVPRVLVGQKATIDTPAAGRQLTGQVITATSLADIQKNTLQVKVAIDDPPPSIKPDMLVQVTFLAPPREIAAAAQPTTRIAAPRSLIEGSGEQATVWVADVSAGVARRRQVSLGQPLSQELVEVKSGLAIGDRLIVGGREQLKDGQRIRVSGEDSAIGRGTQ